MSDYLFKFRLFSLPLVCWVSSILFGFGIVNGRVTLLAITFAIVVCVFLVKRAEWTVFAVVGLILISLFLYLYYLFYKIPVMPAHIDGSIQKIGYLLKALPVLLSYLIVFALPDRKQKERFFTGIAFGMLLFAVVNSVATLIYLDPPYYGRAFHYFHKTEYNSPGITILASMLPLVLFCFGGYLFEITKTWEREKIFFLVVLLINISISYLFSARTFFFIIAGNVFVLILIRLWNFFSISSKSIYYKVGIGFLALFLFVLSVYCFLKFTYIGQRVMTGVYSEKINHHIDYWQTIQNGFFVYPKITIGASFTFWYHNVFFDAHKTSGPYTALILYSYAIFILVLAIRNSFLKISSSKYYLHFYLCFIPYLVTTIPWESSESQMMTLFAGLGALILTAKNEPVAN
ncbi:DUF1229 domain-containing protein [Leptospira barantonii]|uniref:DUF1229 domain-containing protein n=1 Tax=Leptospira barantonii TaxID=2023184 RepID=A0A5F2B118_9LEPT|nr:DUF1229 domain-containing protein [Leptospira barantonii]TGL98124.1 DUF1229 domain-containing protein [Leptospira barantonii]